MKNLVNIKWMHPRSFVAMFLWMTNRIDRKTPWNSVYSVVN